MSFQHCGQPDCQICAAEVEAKPMSRRDYFAAAALTGFASKQIVVASAAVCDAVELADRLIAALDKPKEGEG